MPESERNDLLDKKIYFCDHEIKQVPKNKFFVRKDEHVSYQDKNNDTVEQPDAIK
jgi:hypothetical protein